MAIENASCLIDRLPNEIWQQIFAFVYPSFHLRYTQTHDHLPQSGWEQNLELVSLYDLRSLPLMHELPRLGSLLVCRKFHEVGKDTFQRAFTGDVHIVGRMIFKTVHHSYAGLMALTKNVVIAEEFLWTFLSLNFKDKMPKLERLISTMQFMSERSLSYELIDGAITIKTINRRYEIWADALKVALFDQLGGMTSATFTLRKRWEDLGIKTTYRYTHYALPVGEPGKCDHLVVS